MKLKKILSAINYTEHSLGIKLFLLIFLVILVGCSADVNYKESTGINIFNENKNFSLILSLKKRFQ